MGQSRNFGELPEEIFVRISTHLPSIKDKAHLAGVRHQWYRIFQPDIQKQAKEEAEYAIYPTKENVEKLEKLLKNYPAFLLHPLTVKNRHGQAIHGTAYQIALHEWDDELIADVIKPAFEQLPNGLETMEAQRQTWLPEGWLEAEEKACAKVLTAIDNLFAAFRSASNPNDVTELPNRPYTITINHEGAKEALRASREAMDALYVPTDEVITSGRDPSIRLLERIITKYEKNYAALGGWDSPRNHALVRQCFGYGQRFSPINLMQAYAQGPAYIVLEKEKLTRTFEYRNGSGGSILPLDSNSALHLGYEYCVIGGRKGALGDGKWVMKDFFNQKHQHLYIRALRDLGIIGENMRRSVRPSL